MLIVPVILAGGAGERLWPLSKLDFPKQFISIHGAPHSLFQDTVRRCADRTQFHAPVVVCSEQHRFLVLEQLHALGVMDAQLCIEPVGRNTAPALALAALSLPPEAVMLVLPSDHRITNADAFLAAVVQGVAAAQAGYIVTFSVTATAPETAYGYIRRGARMAAHPQVHAVAAFIEKPDATTAANLIAGGDVGWNSGIFLLTAQRALAELEAHAHAVLAHLRAGTMDACPALSIDYAVMEKTRHAATIPVDMGWSDMGSFAALAATLPTDAQGNACTGNTLPHDTERCYLHSDGRLIATLGLRDMMVVAADNALLIAPTSRAQEMKPLLQQLQQHHPSEAALTHMVHRPWGRFHRLDHSPHHQVKRLHLNAGAKISLQSHQHRAEHWIILEGVATVTQGEVVQRFAKHQSTYIPAGTVHRLENRESTPLVLIEVQTGDYVGEDDITRFEDQYHRP